MRLQFCYQEVERNDDVDRSNSSGIDQHARLDPIKHRNEVID